MNDIDFIMPSVKQARKRAIASWAFQSAATMTIGIASVVTSNNLLFGGCLLAAIFTAKSTNAHVRTIKNLQNQEARKIMNVWNI